MIIDIQVRSEHDKLKDLYISYFDKNGDIAFHTLPLNHDRDGFVWEECAPIDKRANKNFITWDGKCVRRMPSTRLNKYRIEEILMLMSEEELAPLLEFNIPKKFIIDIETEVIDGFPDAETAANRVLSISIVNSTDKKVTVLALRPLEKTDLTKIESDINKYFEKFGDTWKLNYLAFESEYDMVYSFFSKFIHKMPCITGWNLINYDWQYLINRCARLKIDPAICSSTGVLIGKNMLPQHRLIVDYLEIVQKWDRVIKIKENFKLDYIAEVATGLGKIKYNGSLRDLYEQEFVKFIYYNAVDSVLVHYIDKKLNTLATFFKLAQVSRIETNRVFSPVWTLDCLMTREFFNRGCVFVAKENVAEQQHFEGAYVKEPVHGLHEWVTCYDFASLYPTIIRQFNLSPESFKRKLQTDEKFMEDEIMTSNGNIFDDSKDSVLRTIINDLYARRKKTKKKMLDINKEIDVLFKALK